MNSEKNRTFLRQYRDMLSREFRGYGLGRFGRDVLAGITVGAVSLPLALAFGAANLGAEFAAFGIAAGLTTAIIAGIVTGLLGGGAFQVSGPTGTMSVVLAGVVATRGLQGMFLVCLLAGLLRLLGGLFRLGKLVFWIPHPVVIGFTSGVSVLIALGQLDNAFGVSLSGRSIPGRLVDFFSEHLQDINWWAVGCTLLVMVCMFLYPKKWAAVLPGSLVAIVLLSALVQLVHALDPGTMEIALIGAIPSSPVNAEALRLSEISLESLRHAFAPAVTIAILGMVETLLCGTSAASMTKRPFEPSVEMVAQGVGNMVIPFFEGVPSTAAIARTSVAIRSGAQTRLTGVVQSLFLLACMSLLSGLIGLVPYTALAGVLIVTAWRTNDWPAIRHFFRHRLWDAILPFTATLLATVLLDVIYAILIGVLVAVLFMLPRLARLDLQAVLRQDVLYLHGSGVLFFANAKDCAEAILTYQAAARRVVLVCDGITCLDVSAAEVLREAADGLRLEGKEFYLSGVRAGVRRTLDKTGFTARLGEGCFLDAPGQLPPEGLPEADGAEVV
ncbi:MAG: SulP family inorganic anion transporter [Eubacteriales bacterium]